MLASALLLEFTVFHFVLFVMVLAGLVLAFLFLVKIASKHANLLDDWAPPPGYTKQEMNASSPELSSPSAAETAKGVTNPSSWGSSSGYRS